MRNTPIMSIEQYARSIGGVTSDDVMAHIRTASGQSWTASRIRLFEAEYLRLKNARDATLRAYWAAEARGEIASPFGNREAAP